MKRTQLSGAVTTVSLAGALVFTGVALAGKKGQKEGDRFLGIPKVMVPADNPLDPEKCDLGDKLFHDTRFSKTGKVSCATCHDAGKGFTDNRATSEGINGLTGTRSAPTVLNAAFYDTQFWDGRSPDLEDQSQHPFVNPIEMGLESHDPILKIVRADPDYQARFKKVFGVEGDAIQMEHVQKAIATFERRMIAGDSAFDRWFYAGDEKAMTKQQVRGYELFIGKARCVDCHVIEQTQATFTDNKFHNIGVGVNKISEDLPELASAFIKAQMTAEEVDKKVLSDPKASELGRFAVQTTFDGLGAFKTPTLRNVELTAPYFHDGSVKTLEKVVEHYNNGGVTKPGDPVSPYLSGGIRPLNLTKQEIKDVAAFMRALTSKTMPKTKFAKK